MHDSTEDEQVTVHSDFVCNKPQIPTYNLSMVMKKDDYNQAFDSFIFQDTIIRWNSQLIDGDIMDNANLDNAHSFKYLVTYALVGIPTPKYNWLLQQASTSTKKLITTKHLSQSNGYSWIIVDIETNSVGCYVYSGILDDLISPGTILDVMCTLKSDVCGFGHFKVCAMLDTSDPFKSLFLKFTMQKFQLTDKIQKRDTPRIEPPADVMTLLNLN